MNRQWITCLLALGLISACGEPAAPIESGEFSLDTDEIARVTASLDGQRIRNADQEPGNWLAHARTYDESRFSQLDQINVDNVADLGLAWYFDTGTNRGLEASPIVVDGVMCMGLTVIRKIVSKGLSS